VSTVVIIEYRVGYIFVIDIFSLSNGQVLKLKKLLLQLKKPPVFTVATSLLVLCCMCDSPRMGCARRVTAIYMWCEQATIEWSWHVVSIFICCHNVKLCALATQAFWLHYKILEG